jgi:predicted enzyme related to lactoylglutathione lyase
MQNQPTANLIAIAPQFVVPDVVKAAEYYRDVFGFQILDYFLDPPVFAMVRRGGVEIHFGKSDDESAQGQSNRSVRRGIGLDAYIWVDDLDRFVEEIRAKDAKIIEGPVRRVYGMYEVIVEDCHGFVLAFGE